MTQRQRQARNWLIAYTMWIVALFLWNAGWFDSMPDGHKAMEYYLFFMLVLLVIVGIAQR